MSLIFHHTTASQSKETPQEQHLSTKEWLGTIRDILQSQNKGSSISKAKAAGQAKVSKVAYQRQKPQAKQRNRNRSKDEVRPQCEASRITPQIKRSHIDRPLWKSVKWRGVFGREEANSFK